MTNKMQSARIVVGTASFAYKLGRLMTLAVMLLCLRAYGANACAPVVTNAFITPINGIMTGVGLPSGGGGFGGCMADKAWAGVDAQQVPVLALAPGQMNPQATYMFVAAHGDITNPNTNLDQLLVGVHVQNTPNLSTDDHVTLYFHFGNGATFSPGLPDFALTYDVGAAAGTPDATPTDAECSKDPINTPHLFKFVSTASPWSSEIALAMVPWITTKKSWNFPAVPGPGIWELEVAIDLKALCTTAPGACIAQKGTNLFSIGAKVYERDEALTDSTIFMYPTNLEGTLPNDDITNTAFYLPNNPVVVTAPSSLTPFDVGAQCGLDVQITSAAGTDQGGNVGFFTTTDSAPPLKFNGSGNAINPNHFTAKVKLVNPNDASDNHNLTTPDTGNVKFSIMPYNGGFPDTYTMGTSSVTFTHAQQELTVPVDTAPLAWPATLTQWNDAQGQASAPSSSITRASADHTCIAVDLSGFNIDVPGNNHLGPQNLVFTHSSAIRDSFTISAPNRAEAGQNGYIDYVLRVNWQNIGNKGGWKYEFEDSHDTGLKRIGKLKSYYSLRVKTGETKRVRVEIRGGSIPGTAKQYMLPATAGGTLLSPANGTPPLEIPVKPGTTMAVVAHGAIRLHSKEGAPSNDANGTLLGPPPQQGPGVAGAPGASNSAQVCDNCGRGALLKDGYYRAAEHQGALIGSFDGFKTAFVIGTNSTFLVPGAATTLALAVNDQAGQYADHTGNFQLNVIASAPVVAPTLVAQPAYDPAGIPVQMEAGTGMPRLNIEVMEVIPKNKVLLPAGYVSWAVYSSHKRGPFWWLWPGNW